MPIKLGSTNISKVFLGTNPVNKAYLGSTLLFDATPAPQIPKYWRYVRYIGHGDQTGVTSRLVEFQALQGATNRLLGKLPISGQAPAVGNIAVATDGAIVHASGYPLWWSGEGIPDLIYDLGDWYEITSVKVVGYSPAGDPRTNSV